MASNKNILRILSHETYAYPETVRLPVRNSWLFKHAKVQQSAKPILHLTTQLAVMVV